MIVKILFTAEPSFPYACNSTASVPFERRIFIVFQHSIFFFYCIEFSKIILYLVGKLTLKHILRKVSSGNVIA